MGRDSQEVNDMMEELNFEPSVQMTFDEFLQIMKNLEDRLAMRRQNEIGANQIENIGSTLKSVGPVSADATQPGSKLPSDKNQ